MEPLVEHLLDPPVDAALPAGAGVLAVVGPTRSVATVDGAWFPVGDGPIPTDVADVAGQVFALVDGRVEVWVGDQLVDAGFGGFLAGTPRALSADAESLWIETDSAVFRWRAGLAAELEVEGASVAARVAPGGVWGPERVVWLAVGPVVHGFAVNASFVQGFETRAFEAPVDGVLVADGALLVVEGGRLWTRDADRWAAIPLDERVYGVFGGPGGAWLRTDGGLRLWRADALWSVAGLPETDGRWFADELGRLLVRSDAGLDRYTLHRPLRLEGLTSGQQLNVATTIEVSPTAADEVSSLRVEVRPESGAALELPATDGVVVLDPAALTPGPATLVVTATYPDQTAELQVPFTVELVGDVTWAQHIEPIHTARCAGCHEDSANTVLDGAASWESAIDDILANVTSGAMPLVGEPLTVSQQDLITTWRNTGFLP